MKVKNGGSGLGGVEGALAKRAQAIFETARHEGSDQAAVALFRRLFTRLVTLGEGSEDTRRIVVHDELGPDAWALAQKLANKDNRLVVTAASTLGRETAEVVHEALIRNWPTLVNWVNRDRDLLSWRDQLKPRLNEWRANREDEGGLLQGRLLAVAEDWLAQRGKDLNEEEKTFIDASASSDNIKIRQSKFLFLIILGIGVLSLTYFSLAAPNFGIVTAIFQLLTFFIVFYLTTKSGVRILSMYVIVVFLLLTYLLFANLLIFVLLFVDVE